MEFPDAHTILFFLFAGLTCGFAVAVVLATRIVRMAFYLVLCLGCVAGLFFLAGAEFVAATQLLVYVGGTLVLLVFGVMLTSPTAGVQLRPTRMDWVMALVPGGLLLALLVQTILFVPEWTSGPGETVNSPADVTTAIGLALVGVRPDDGSRPRRSITPTTEPQRAAPPTADTAERSDGGPSSGEPAPEASSAEGAVAPLVNPDRIAELPPPVAEVVTIFAVRSRPVTYLLPFAVISVHLVVVLVGAAYLARTKVVYILPERRLPMAPHGWRRGGILALIGLDVVKMLVLLAAGVALPRAAMAISPEPLAEELSRVCGWIVLMLAAANAIQAVTLAAALQGWRVAIVWQALPGAALVAMFFLGGMPILGAIATVTTLLVSGVVAVCLFGPAGASQTPPSQASPTEMPPTQGPPSDGPRTDPTGGVSPGSEMAPSSRQEFA